MRRGSAGITDRGRTTTSEQRNTDRRRGRRDTPEESISRSRELNDFLRPGSRSVTKERASSREQAPKRGSSQGSPAPSGELALKRDSTSRSPLPSGRKSPAPLAEPKDVTQVFRQFDVNGDGMIDRNELMQVLQELDPERWTNRNITLLLMALDANFDGRINYQEFVDWVSEDGTDQKEFREYTGMPRSRVELQQLEAERKAAALKGTETELEANRADVVVKLEALKTVESRLVAVRARFNKLKVDAEKASEIFMPSYEKYCEASEDVTVPAKSVLDHEIKEVSEQIKVVDKSTQVSHMISNPPTGARLVANAMCVLFKVHPGTRIDLEPDYWTAFIEGLLNPKLLEQMEKFDKENVPEDDVKKISGICRDEQFKPQQVSDQTQQMEKTSNFMVTMCLWVHFIDKYRKAGVKKMWEQVHHAEVELEKVESSLTKKQDELKDAKKKVERLEIARAAIEQE